MSAILKEAVCLTDEPLVVELKREYRCQDEQEEALKSELRYATESNEVVRIRAERERIEQRKKEIAQQIFQAANSLSVT
jgi:hypothetical protein